MQCLQRGVPLYASIYEHRRIIAEEEELVAAPEPFVMGLCGKIIGSNGLCEFGCKLARFTKFVPKVGPLNELKRVFRENSAVNGTVVFERAEENLNATLIEALELLDKGSVVIGDHNNSSESDSKELNWKHF